VITEVNVETIKGKKTDKLFVGQKNKKQSVTKVGVAAKKPNGETKTSK